MHHEGGEVGGTSEVVGGGETEGGEEVIEGGGGVVEEAVVAGLEKDTRGDSNRQCTGIYQLATHRLTSTTHDNHGHYHPLLPQLHGRQDNTRKTRTMPIPRPSSSNRGGGITLHLYSNSSHSISRMDILRGTFNLISIHALQALWVSTSTWPINSSSSIQGTAATVARVVGRDTINGLRVVREAATQLHDLQSILYLLHFLVVTFNGGALYDVSGCSRGGVELPKPIAPSNFPKLVVAALLMAPSAFLRSDHSARRSRKLSTTCPTTADTLFSPP